MAEPIEARRSGYETPPNAGEVGNHHWPKIANYFSEHGAQFLPHHDHNYLPGANTLALLEDVHSQRHFDLKLHDEYANYHVPLEVEGCRSPGMGYSR
jgi:hypothetical protein